MGIGELIIVIAKNVIFFLICVVAGLWIDFWIFIIIIISFRLYINKILQI